MSNQAPGFRSTTRQRDDQSTALGVGQLSLVEHALCPLDARHTLRSGSRFEWTYRYTDTNGVRQSANVRVVCPLGLSGKDEFYLWGLLALTMQHAGETPNLQATPHFCLRQLGLIDQHARRGGRQYRQFAETIERLSAIRYQNDAFFDPVRGEHRRVSFGFFSYSLPADSRSSRAWRFAWDPIFYELLQPYGGHLSFDLTIYRELDVASRRLFLLLSKVFRRRSDSPRFDLHHLAVNVLGFAETLATRDLKAKTARCIERLIRRTVVGCEKSSDAIHRVGNGRYVVKLRRGSYFNKRHSAIQRTETVKSPLVEPLRSIGFDNRQIAGIIKRYPTRLVQEWADITLAAQERHGMRFFTRSPQAYFIDNVKNATAGNRTPPDWWHEVRKAEERSRVNQVRRHHPDPSNESPSDNSDDLTNDVFRCFVIAGQDEDVARQNADRFGREMARRSRTNR